MHHHEEISLISRRTELDVPPQPEDFLYPSIIIWSPFEEHNLENTVKCPLCQSNLITHNKYWTDGVHSFQPRTLHSFDHLVLLVSRVYQCISKQTLLAHDERLLQMLAKSVNVPFVLLHKTGFTKEFINRVVALCNNGLNFFKIESMSIEGHWNYHSILEQKFWQHLKEYKSHHPMEDLQTIAFPTFTIDRGPLCNIPSNDAIAQCFLKDFMEKEKNYISEMAHLTSDIWISCDHTFKVASNIGYLREDKKWIQQYSAVFFVLNNVGKVISWQFTNGTSFAEIQTLLKNLKHRFETQGSKIQKVAVDNCCHWRSKIQDIFGNSTSVYLDVFHAVQRISRVLPKKHRLFHKCIDDLRFVFRTSGDVGIKRCKPTPLPDEMLENMERFVKKWKDTTHSEVPLLNDGAINEIIKLKVHIRKGCLSNIEVGCGTNQNEALHRHINSFFYQSRISMLLAYALMTVLIYSHNSAQQIKPKRVIKPIHAIIAEEAKQSYLSSLPDRATTIKENFGIMPKDLSHLEDNGIFYDKLSEELEGDIFDFDTATTLLSNAVQQSMVLNKMKDCKQLHIYSVMQKEIEKLITSPKDAYIPNNQFLNNLLESNNLQLIPVPGDGNCCFTAVGKGLQCILQENGTHKLSLLNHVNSIGLQISDLQYTSLQLRRLTVEEWTGSNKGYYENFLVSHQNIDDAAKKFAEPGYFQNDLGDLMILALCNVLHVPIIIFSNIPYQPVIPVLPRETHFDFLLFVAYNHIGAGHYDAAVMKKRMLSYPSNDSFCRCGVNGDKLSCSDTERYHTRCKCFKQNIGCSQLCKCKNCSNTFGRRSLLGKRNRVMHKQQYTLPSSKAFAEDRCEKIKYGPWTLLENVILAHVLENFSKNLEDMTVENILKGFNEIVTFSKMPHCTVQIPQYIMSASHKNLMQMNGKLQSPPLQNNQSDE